MERVADVAREDGCARAPLGGLFDDLGAPDPTLAVALARVLVMCEEGKEGACAISATELAVSIASGADAAVYSDRVRSRESRTRGGIAALQMYTLEFSGTSVFEALNEALRSKVRAKCAPFRWYIWMLMHAMREAPAFDVATVYRGVREDLRATYKKGRTVTWHGFSSCTTSLGVLQSEQFCGASEERTIFIIALTQGRARWIADVSMVETEDEVLLPPNTRVRVDSTLDAGSGLVLVSLTELEPLDPILLFGPSERGEEVEAVEAERGEEVEAVEAERSEELEAVEAERSEEVDAPALEISPAPHQSHVPLHERDTSTRPDATTEHALAGTSKDPRERALDATSRWRKAAAQGKEYNMGYALYHGDGVRVDAAAGVEWLRKAAEQGHAEAQELLGLAYFCGNGVPIDKPAALEWWRNAEMRSRRDATEQGEDAASVEWLRKDADHGDEVAQYRMGLVLYYGDGAPVDKAAALGWWRKAAEQGHEKARCFLDQYDAEPAGPIQAATEALEEEDAEVHFYRGLAYRDGSGVERDDALALKWLRKAAEQGHADAQYTVGYAYDNGIGVACNFDEAAKWIRKAAEQGHMDAQYSTGRSYESGIGVMHDKKAAAAWYRKAAEQGLKDAQYSLGYAYVHGDGVAVDSAAGVGWFRKVTRAACTSWVGHTPAASSFG
jgi:TPR repeat protein